ncbi:MAG TPA: ABC transporter ATP-binding protein [Polyangiaceae bacterium]|nr:ABC transporter ATP-binding protein [Polyangiaceae bacterium]
MALLSVRDLKTHFFTEDGVVRAVDGVSFDVERGEVLCIVGESGSGKSVTGLSILGLVPDPPGRIVAGEILLEREDLTRVGEKRLRDIRGGRIAMIFQDPMTSLNPYLSVRTQLAEVLSIHEGVKGAEADKRIVAMLGDVGIPAPESRLSDYPHQLSGGMRQRVMIAMALLCKPDVLIADEPTTALDVTIQAQILELLEKEKKALDLAIILITHDLGVVAKMADRVAVMYAGRIVEQGTAAAVLGRPCHPYTLALRRSIPRLDDASREVLPAVRGMPPPPGKVPAGCPFHPRCDHVVDRCREAFPEERELDGRRLSCHVDVKAGDAA